MRAPTEERQRQIRAWRKQNHHNANYTPKQQRALDYFRVSKFPGILVTPCLEAKIYRADGEHYRDDTLTPLTPEQRTQLLERGFELHGDVWYGPDCTVEDLGVIARRSITTIGVNFEVDAKQNLTEVENINFHSMGTNSTAEAIGDTGTLTEVETRATGTQSEPAANQYRSVGTITATAIRSIVEHCIHWASSGASTGYDRSVFTAIALAVNDSIQFTYTLTYTAGG